MSMRFACSIILPLHSCMNMSFITARSVLLIACATDQQSRMVNIETGKHLLFVGLPCSLLFGGFALQHFKAPLIDAAQGS